MRARLDDFVRTGFVLLDERPGEEIVVGLVRRLGRLRGGVAGVEAETFASFDQPGYGKAAMNFRVEARGPSSALVSTETRGLATDESARRAFARYWRVVGPFSALIRRQMLAVVSSAVTRPSVSTSGDDNRSGLSRHTGSSHDG